MLPPTIPIFPLPNVVLFPHVFLPLHIFEPRYRAMVADALEGDRLIGMVLLRPGWEGRYDGRPPVYPIGCAGVITHHDRLPDGRYNIVLRGLQKFRITGEDEGRLYRVARIEGQHETLAEGEREEIGAADVGEAVGQLEEAVGGRAARGARRGRRGAAPAGQPQAATLTRPPAYVTSPTSARLRHRCRAAGRARARR